MSIKSLSTSSFTAPTKGYANMSAVSRAGGIPVHYVVVSGGGGGGVNSGTGSPGAGGAGGYRANVSGEASGGPQQDGSTQSTAEKSLSVTPGTECSIVVGAGGAVTTPGSPSRFYDVIANGGGKGGGNNYEGGQGGSAGGIGTNTTGGRSHPTNVFGQGWVNNGAFGGGAGGSGTTGGGPGLETFITGSSLWLASGGGGGVNPGGGGSNGVSGAANTGGGGGQNSTTGGSGIVILRVPQGTPMTFSGGVTQTSSTYDVYDVYTVTATSTLNETVTIG